MIPLYDTKKSKKIPFITILLILINIVLFFLMQNSLEFFISKYGFRIDNFLGVFSSMFIHISFWHVLGNMWFLWVFGDPIEGKIGHLKFLGLYFFAGIGACLFYFLFNSFNVLSSVIGASGAISGILGAYLILFPKHKLKVFPCFKILAIVYIIAWFLLQFFLTSSSVAYLGHVGGFLMGVLYIKYVN